MDQNLVDEFNKFLNEKKFYDITETFSDQTEKYVGRTQELAYYLLHPNLYREQDPDKKSKRMLEQRPVRPLVRFRR